MTAEQLLTPRQIEVLKLVASGQSHKEIGVELGIDHWTVRVHVQNIYDRLGIRRNVVAMTRWAIAEGLVSVEVKHAQSSAPVVLPTLP